MFTVIVILTSLLAILLIAVVLIQPGKGDMAAGFGGVGMGESAAVEAGLAVDLHREPRVARAVVHKVSSAECAGAVLWGT